MYVLRWRLAHCIYLMCQALRCLGDDISYNEVVTVPELVGRAIHCHRHHVLYSVSLEFNTQRICGGISRWPTYAELPLECATSLAAPIVAARMDPRTELAVKMLRSSKHIKLTKGIHSAVADVAGIVFGPDTVAEALKSQNVPAFMDIGLLRSRFDMAITLAMRTIFQWMFLHCPGACFYLFVDGSPASGFEALTAAEHHAGLTHSWDRLLTITFLGFGFMGVLARAHSLLWKIYIEVGPNEALLRWRLKSIRGFTTDWGSESKLPYLRDCLQTFLVSIGSTLEVTPAKFLFPLAVWACGWHHKWDNIMREVCESLVGWPFFLRS